MAKPAIAVPAAVKSSFDDVRKAMAGKDAYARAYKESSEAYAEGRRVKEVAAELTELTPEELDRLLDPAELNEGGIKGAASGG